MSDESPKTGGELHDVVIVGGESAGIATASSLLKGAVAAFAPEANEVILDNGERIAYRILVAAPGIKLDWGAIEGLPETLGKNGVTSNYRFDLALYTWRLVQECRGGRALFTQPPMPIKCAGAPQKAPYLSCDEWFRNGHLKNTTVELHNAGGVLFGVKDYVPALMESRNIAWHSTSIAVSSRSTATPRKLGSR